MNVISRFSGLAALMLLAGTTMFAGKPPDTVTTLSFVPSASLPQFSAGSAVITVTSSGLPVTSGTVTLFQTKAQGVPSSCSAQKGNSDVQPPLTQTPDANGQVSFNLLDAGLTSTVGSFGLIAKFKDAGNYGSSESICLDLTITISDGGLELCPAGQNATISTSFVNSPGFPLPGTYTWNLLISVHACKDLTLVSAQGGKNAWTGATFGAPTKGEVKLRKAVGGNNEVSIWTIGSMNAGQTVNLPVSITGSVKPKTACGTVLGLLGSWSALSTSVDFGSLKSDYSGTSTVTVGPDPCI